MPNEKHLGLAMKMQMNLHGVLYNICYTSCGATTGAWNSTISLLSRIDPTTRWTMTWHLSLSYVPLSSTVNDFEERNDNIKQYTLMFPQLITHRS